MTDTKNIIKYFISNIPLIGKGIMRTWNFLRWRLFYWWKPPIIDFYDPEFQNDPYPTYHRIRDESSVYKAGINYFLSEHETVGKVLRTAELKRKQGNALPPEQAALLYDLPEEASYFMELLYKMILFTDPPFQTRVRNLIHKYFTPRLIRDMRPTIQNVVDELLDAVEDKETMDIMEDLAIPLPQIIINDILGLPREDRKWIHKRTTDLVLGLDPPRSIEPFYAGSKAAKELAAYIEAAIEDRRQNPGEDIISQLFKHEQNGEIAYDEIVAMIILLMIAGSETTANLIGMGMIALLQNPDEIEKLKADPTLYPNAVDELLRYVTPVQLAFRYPPEKIEIQGTTIPRGGSMCLLVGAANRDPDVFAEPDKLDVNRKNAGEHISFGAGIHYCIGAPLARLEGEIAFKELLNRFPDMQLLEGGIEQAPFIVLRGMQKIRVTL